MRWGHASARHAEIVDPVRRCRWASAVQMISGLYTRYSPRHSPQDRQYRVQGEARSLVETGQASVSQ